MSLLRQLRSLFRKQKLDAEMTEEMRHHVELQTELNLKAGMNPDEARYAALRQFGNVARIQEQAREGRGWVWLEQCLRDAGFAIHALSRSPGFTFAVWGMLAIGIGVVTVMFGLTSQILFAQPYPHYDRLFLIGSKDKQNPLSANRLGLHLKAYQEQVPAFSRYAAVQPNVTNLVIGDAPIMTRIMGASPDCFGVLGIKPVLGRGFRPEEFRSGADQVIILTDLFWRQHFNADPMVLGRTVRIDQNIYTVIGVLDVAQPFPPSFQADVYHPLVLKVDPATPLVPLIYIIGQLRSGVPVEQARRELNAVKLPTMPGWATAYLADQEVVLTKPAALARPETLWVLLVAAVLLYAIASLNAMNLMFVRLLGRCHEVSIRLSLGGTRWQIMRLFVLEGVGLALLASLTVIFAAHLGLPQVLAALSRNQALLYASAWNWRIVGCITTLSVLACLIVVALPVWRFFRVDISAVLKDGGQTIGGSPRAIRLRMGLVMLQTALAVVLLAGAGLLMQSLEKLNRVNLGFDPVGKAKVQVAFPPGYDPKPEARMQIFERLQQRLATLPDVKGVSIGQDSLLLERFYGSAQLRMADGTYQPVAGSFVAGNYPQVSGLVLKRGRWFVDKPGSLEVVINEALARARFGSEDPVGKSIQLRVSGKVPILVVGVVADARESVRVPAGIRLYMSNWIYPANITMLLLRLERDPGEEFAGRVRKAIYDSDPKLIVYMVSSLGEMVDKSLWVERNAFAILKWLSAFALGLAVIGLFSVLAFVVDSRRREFGIRMALGAAPAHLHRLVIVHGLRVTAIGVLAGTMAALGLTRFMQSLLFETTPNDPPVYLAVAAMLLATALLACWLPARRAAKVDPVIALRAE